MPKTGIQVLKEIMDSIKTHGFTLQIEVAALDPIIEEQAGMDKRTIQKYKNLLCKRGYLKTLNHIVFEIKAK